MKEQEHGQHMDSIIARSFDFARARGYQQHNGGPFVETDDAMHIGPMRSRWSEKSSVSGLAPCLIQ